jgi:hypothetical protein
MTSPPPWDSWDAGPSAIHIAVEDLGPFETEQQARELPAVRAVYADGAGKMTAHSLSMLLDALAEAGVYLGAYDHRIAEWLAGWEPQTVAVIAGWVQRASAAAVRADELPAKMRGGPPGRDSGAGRQTGPATANADLPPAQAPKS